MGKAITAELKKLIEEKAYEPEHIFDKEGTCLNRKKMSLCAVISKDENVKVWSTQEQTSSPVLIEWNINIV